MFFCEDMYNELFFKIRAMVDDESIKKGGIFCSRVTHDLGGDLLVMLFYCKVCFKFWFRISFVGLFEWWGR